MTACYRPQFQHKTGRTHGSAAGLGKGGKPGATEQLRSPNVVRSRTAQPGFPEYGILRS
jgi:hypothetical protein